MGTLDDVLEHHGIKGMKWGVRKATRVEGSSSEDARSSHAARVKIKTNKGTHALSNKELQDIVTRLNLEQQYSRLTSTPSGIQRIKQGNEAVKTIIAVGVTVATIHKFATSPTGRSIAARFLK